MFSGNGKIEFEEFVDLLEKMKRPEKEEESYRDSFRAFDMENKGYILASELRETILHVMEKCPEKDKQNIIKVFRLNEERNVTFEGNNNFPYYDISVRQNSWYHRISQDSREVRCYQPNCVRSTSF